jgi:hypothetical protein
LLELQIINIELSGKKIPTNLGKTITAINKYLTKAAQYFISNNDLENLRAVFDIAKNYVAYEFYYDLLQSTIKINIQNKTDQILMQNRIMMCNFLYENSDVFRNAAFSAALMFSNLMIPSDADCMFSCLYKVYLKNNFLLFKALICYGADYDHGAYNITNKTYVPLINLFLAYDRQNNNSAGCDLDLISNSAINDLDQAEHDLKYPLISEEYKNKRIGLKFVSDAQIINIKEKLNLNESHIIGTAIGDSGCFFDSLAQTLNLYFNTQKYTEQSLRLACCEYVTSNVMKATRLINSDNKSTLNILNYVQEMSKTGQDVEVPQCGRTEIEGVMLCRQLNIDKFYIYEIGKDNDGVDYYDACEITKKGVKNIDWNKDNINMPCLVVKDLHFVPILIINQIANENKCATLQTTSKRDHTHSVNEYIEYLLEKNVLLISGLEFKNLYPRILIIDFNNVLSDAHHSNKLIKGYINDLSFKYPLDIYLSSNHTENILLLSKIAQNYNMINFSYSLAMSTNYQGMNIAFFNSSHKNGIFLFDNAHKKAVFINESHSNTNANNLCIACDYTKDTLPFTENELICIYNIFLERCATLKQNELSNIVEQINNYTMDNSHHLDKITMLTYTIARLIMLSLQPDPNLLIAKKTLEAITEMGSIRDTIGDKTACFSYCLATSYIASSSFKNQLLANDHSVFDLHAVVYTIQLILNKSTNALNIFINSRPDIQLLLSSEIPGSNGFTFLHYACKMLDYSSIKILIQHGATNLSKINSNGVAPLNFIMDVKHKKDLILYKMVHVLEIPL